MSCRPNIPVPQDDGAARHLAGMKLPDLALPATDGSAVNLSKLKGRTVVYIYPRTGVPGVDPPPGWDADSGRARLHAAVLRVPRPFRRAQAARRRAALRAVDAGHRLSARGGERLHLPFAILSDDEARAHRALKLPTFTVAGMTLLKRMALVIDDGIITQGVLSGVSARQECRGGDRLARASERVEYSVRARSRTPRGTSPASARRYWCCSASSDSWRTASSAPSVCLPPCSKGAADFLAPSAVTTLSWAMRPSATIARSFGISAMVACRKSRQVAISRRRRLVLRRHAAHRIGDAAVDQLKSVVGMRAVLAAREAVARQRLVEQLAGVVAGERPAGAVGALQAGRQTDDQQARIERAERGDRRVEPGRLVARAMSCGTPTSRGQRGQSRPGLPSADRMAGLRDYSSKSSSSAPTSAVARPAAAPADAAGIAACAAALAIVARTARFAGGALGRIAADLALQLDDVDEDVGLAAQFVGHHRRLRGDGRDHGHAHAARCTASTSERKSPSPENSTMWSIEPAISMASTASSMSMLPLTLRRPVWSTNSLVALVTTE